MIRRTVSGSRLVAKPTGASQRWKSNAAEQVKTVPIVHEKLAKHAPVEKSPSSKVPNRPLNEDNDYVLKDGNLVERPAGFTFGGGPGAVRDVVKQRAAKELLGGGLLEMSHREPGPIHQVLTSTQDLIRDLLSVPRDYDILFIQGGAHAQFSAVPLNFGNRPKAVSMILGSWSEKSTIEQKKFAEVEELRFKVLESEQAMMSKFAERLSSTKSDYGYICTNETMQGIQFRNDKVLPQASPVVADSTSDLFSRRVDVSKYGVIFASGGKNLGPAGFAVVIARKDIINRKTSDACPSFLSWKEYANSKPIANVYHTPPMLSIGVAKMVLDDLAHRGGLEWAEKRTAKLANEIYLEIDGSQGFYKNSIPKNLRSNVSVVFGIPSSNELEAKFISQAASRGLLQLVNHPSVGGMRASLYNAVPVKAVEELIKFMREFRSTHQA